MVKKDGYRLTQQVQIHGWSCKLGADNLENLLKKVGLSGKIEDSAVLPIPNSDLLMVKIYSSKWV